MTAYIYLAAVSSAMFFANFELIKSRLKQRPLTSEFEPIVIPYLVMRWLPSSGSDEAASGFRMLIKIFVTKMSINYSQRNRPKDDSSQH